MSKKLPNFSDDSKFFTYEYEDETSMYDPKGVWVGGGDYYSRTYRCRIPLSIKGNEKKITEYIEKYSEEEGFWVN